MIMASDPETCLPVVRSAVEATSSTASTIAKDQSDDKENPKQIAATEKVSLEPIACSDIPMWVGNTMYQGHTLGIIEVEAQVDW